MSTPPIAGSLPEPNPYRYEARVYHRDSFEAVHALWPADSAVVFHPDNQHITVYVPVLPFPGADRPSNLGAIADLSFGALAPTLPGPVVLGEATVLPPPPPRSLLSALRGNFPNAPSDPTSNAGIDILGDLRSERDARDARLESTMDYYQAVAEAKRYEEYQRLKAKYEADIAEWKEKRKAYMDEVASHLETDAAREEEDRERYKTEFDAWEEQERARRGKRAAKLVAALAEQDRRQKLELTYGAGTTSEEELAQIGAARVGDRVALSRMGSTGEVQDWLDDGVTTIGSLVVGRDPRDAPVIMGDVADPDGVRTALDAESYKHRHAEARAGRILSHRVARELKSPTNSFSMGDRQSLEATESDGWAAAYDFTKMLGTELAKSIPPTVLEVFLNGRGYTKLAMGVNVLSNVYSIVEPADLAGSPYEDPGSPEYKAWKSEQERAYLASLKPKIARWLRDGARGELQLVELELSEAARRESAADHHLAQVKESLPHTDPKVDEAEAAYTATLRARQSLVARRDGLRAGLADVERWLDEND